MEEKKKNKIVQKMGNQRRKIINQLEQKKSNEKFDDDQFSAVC